MTATPTVRTSVSHVQKYSTIVSSNLSYVDQYKNVMVLRAAGLRLHISLYKQWLRNVDAIRSPMWRSGVYHWAHICERQICSLDKV